MATLTLDGITYEGKHIKVVKAGVEVDGVLYPFKKGKP